METLPYFMAKWPFILYSQFFLSIFNLKRELVKVLVVIFFRQWCFDYYPFGISLRGLTFLGMGLFGTGLAFGTVHALAFMGGYYSAKIVLKKFDAPSVRRNPNFFQQNPDVE